MRKTKYLIAAILLIILIAASAALLLWERGNGDNLLELYGNVDIRQVDLGFRVFGRLKSLNFEEGDRVEKGQVMAELDDRPYRLALEEATAGALSVKEKLANSNELFQRREKLVDEKSISKEEYQQSLYNAKVLQANFTEALAAVESGKLRLEDTVLKAPSNGVVTTRVREVGTVLNIGMPVYSVTLDEPIFVRAYVDERELGLLFPGKEAEVLTDTPENPLYRGHIGYISPVAEFTPKNVEAPDLRTSLVYQLRIVIDNPDRGLRRGMPVTIRFSKE